MSMKTPQKSNVNYIYAIATLTWCEFRAENHQPVSTDGDLKRHVVFTWILNMDFHGHHENDQKNHAKSCPSVVPPYPPSSLTIVQSKKRSDDCHAG